MDPNQILSLHLLEEYEIKSNDTLYINQQLNSTNHILLYEHKSNQMTHYI